MPSGLLNLASSSHLRKSKLPLTLPPSKLGRTELLELRLLRALCSPGSVGFRPDDLAKRFRMSVSDITPVRRPDRCAPGIAAAGTEEDEKMGVESGRGDGGAEDGLELAVMTVADMGGDEMLLVP